MSLYWIFHDYQINTITLHKLPSFLLNDIRKRGQNQNSNVVQLSHLIALMNSFLLGLALLDLTSHSILLKGCVRNGPPILAVSLSLSVL